MAQKQVVIEGIGEVTLTKRRGNTNIRLSYARDGSVRVSLPYYVPYQAGIQFARSRAEWLEKHRPSAPSLLTDGMRVGKAHRLSFAARMRGEGARVKIQDNQVVIAHPAATALNHQAVQAAGRRGILKALKTEADQLLPQRLATLAGQHGFVYASVGTKRLSSRWGSCSQTGDIILNIYLMQVPWELIDYVIIHELVHTEHLNHSAGFWARFEQAMPDAKARRKQLKRYRTDIMTG